ncbi:MAG: uracil-DNA glycosylase [Oligoflexia bacterium]|nr:uracil-DNA glycosylase [Oligoflexia bacterium]
MSRSLRSFLPPRAIVMTRANPIVPRQASSKLVFVSEPLGEAEPLFDRMIQAMGLSREEVHIFYVTADQPFHPEPLEAMRPPLVVTLGELATQSLLGGAIPFSTLRGRFHDYRATQNAIPVMPTFHPTYLLSNPASKRETWADLLAVAAKLGIQIPKKES